MACVNPDGTLSASATSILKALSGSGDLNEVARETGLPLFRVRASMRELASANLVEEREETYQPTAAGLDRLRSAES